MNTGIIASRYARALLRYSRESGSLERVFAQVRELLADPDAASRGLEPDISKLFALLMKNGREADVRLVFSSFIRQYCDSEGLLIANLTTAVPSEDTAGRLRTLLEERTGRKVIMDTKVDPAVIGGFVLEAGDCILDASVRRQIDSLRRELITINNRIV